jgi:hypothetical protein
VDQAPTKAWLETLATKLAGRRMVVVDGRAAGTPEWPRAGPTDGRAPPKTPPAPTSGRPNCAAGARQPGVQAMLDVFGLI